MLIATDRFAPVGRRPAQPSSGAFSFKKGRERHLRSLVRPIASDNEFELHLPRKHPATGDRTYNVNAEPETRTEASGL